MDAHDNDTLLTDDDRRRFLTALEAAVAGLGLALSDAMANAMLRHFELLLATNRTLNLTRITAPAEAAVRHYADALALLGWLNGEPRTVRRVLDVGTGGGFPAVPLAIAQPTWRITAIDGTAKKVEAVRQAGEALGLLRLHTRHARGEALTPAAERFDVVCVRAVGPLAASFDVGGRLLTKGGALVCWKGSPAPQDELDASQASARQRGFAPPRVLEYTLAGLDQPRRHTLVIFTRDAKSR